MEVKHGNQQLVCLT